MDSLRLGSRPAGAKPSLKNEGFFVGADSLSAMAGGRTSLIYDE
jgi:hypothetical protein